METPRLLIRALSPADREPFLRGISDRELCRMYGFPEEMSAHVAGEIFAHFSALPSAYALIRRRDGELLGFVTDVETEIPDGLRGALPPRGRTFAYATFSPYQRRGYMLEALRALIGSAFCGGTAYIHCGRFEENVPSALLLEKLGFSVRGRHVYRGRTIVDEILLNDPSAAFLQKE